MADDLKMWVVTKHPSDFPDDYVGRLNRIGVNGAEATGEAIISPDLELVRNLIRERMATDGIEAFRLGPSPSDDPVILEIWV